MTHRVVTGVLSAAIADAGTLAVTYPTGTDEGDFYLAMGHKLVLGQAVLNFPVDFDLTFTTTTITLTNKYGSTWAAGTPYSLELQEPGAGAYRDKQENAVLKRATLARTLHVNLGAPDALDEDGICAAQNRTGAGALLVNGALATGGVATLDRPRNVIADSGGADTAVITVTGTDEYGVVMSEAITLNGTTAVAGKKAFKTITAVSASATVTNSMFLGTGDVLGLPVFLPGSGYVIKEMANGAAATAGTFVAGLRAAEGSTTTSADVRGTYDPNSACDGDIVFTLLLSLPDPGYRGVAQA
jgi:hypothetical protein